MDQVYKVSEYIIQKRNSAEDDDDLTIMELLKLQYISFGYYLALTKKPLFDSPIEAWPYGPVIVDVYNKYKPENGNIVTAKKLENEDISLDSRSKEILDATISAYRSKGAWELSALTHEDGSPWTETVEKKGFYSEIDIDLISKYYSNLISD